MSDQNTPDVERITGTLMRWLQGIATKVRYITGNLIVQLGDAVGGNRFSVRNSAGNEVFGVDSLGNATIPTATITTLAGAADSRITHIENQLVLQKYDTLVTHWQTDTGLPVSWSWANDGVVFTGTPDNISYSQLSHWLYAYQNTTTKRGFANRSAAKGNRISARVSVTVAGSVGLRVDDGTDSNYYEFYLRHVSGPTIDIMTRSRTGGGAVTTTTLTSPLGDAAITLALLIGTGATWTMFAYLVTPTNNLLTAASLGGLTWTPSRAGLLMNPNQGAGAGWCDWIGWL